MKKRILMLVMIIGAFFMLASCDEIKQVISDTLAPKIEETVNSMLNLAEEEKFALPPAKRYEGFSIASSGDQTKYKIDVIEPKVTFEEYATELGEKFGKKFTAEELETAKNMKEWSYRTESGDEYHLSFEEILDEDGNIQKWQIEVTAPNNNAEEKTNVDE